MAVQYSWSNNSHRKAGIGTSNGKGAAGISSLSICLSIGKSPMNTRNSCTSESWYRPPPLLKWYELYPQITSLERFQLDIVGTCILEIGIHFSESGCREQYVRQSTPEKTAIRPCFNSNKEIQKEQVFKAKNVSKTDCHSRFNRQSSAANHRFLEWFKDIQSSCTQEGWNVMMVDRRHRRSFNDWSWSNACFTW